MCPTCVSLQLRCCPQQPPSPDRDRDETSHAEIDIEEAIRHVRAQYEHRPLHPMTELVLNLQLRPQLLGPSRDLGPRQN